LLCYGFELLAQRDDIFVPAVRFEIHRHVYVSARFVEISTFGNKCFDEVEVEAAGV